MLMMPTTPAAITAQSTMAAMILTRIDLIFMCASLAIICKKPTYIIRFWGEIVNRLVIVGYKKDRHTLARYSGLSI